MKDKVDFWFDPLCPWCWITSRWIEEAAELRDFEINWHVISLAILNKDKEDSDKHRKNIEKMLAAVRLITAAKELYGQKYVKLLYEAIGTKLHLEKNDDMEKVIKHSLIKVKLPESLYNYINSTEYDEQLQISHDAGVSIAGKNLGTPIIAINNIGFFGPVITPAPKGEDAAKLWDALNIMTKIPGFYEIKRERTKGPIFD